ncbi:glycosyltransferase family 32 protein, partial [Calocera cornea HHB12733]
ELIQALATPPANPPTPIPKKIWQTHRSEESSPLDTTRTWWETNRDVDGWNRTFLSDEGADQWVREWLGAPQESEIAWVWNTLPRGVLRSDMLRYLVLLLEGGVYSDTDTVCLKPISRWGRFAEVGVIIGVEADVGTRPDWHQWWPRPLQIVQWTLAAPPHHPMMLDALRRVHAATAFAASWLELGGPMSVMEWTGPGVFTDAALTYLTSATAPRDFSWPLLRGLDKPIRVADVTVLPVTGFSPNTGMFGAGSSASEQAMVEHKFAGSWK